VQLADLSVTDDSVVTPSLTVMVYHQKNATLMSRVFCARLIILPDALDAESYRQLRVWLRWGLKRTANTN
jgi:toxin CptA